MSRKAKFTPEEKEQAVIDYLEGNKSRIQIFLQEPFRTGP